MAGMIEISTKGLSREEWLNLRRNGIGGSDAAAILGLSEYSSPYSVWADKLGHFPPKDETWPLRIGRDLEETVAKYFCEETGKSVRRRNAMFASKKYPFMQANIDREVVGEDAGLECKTTSALNMKRFKNGEFPATYYCQCVHYMAVTGKKKWYLAVLIGNMDFRIFEIERDDDEIAALVDAEKAFWEHVKSREPPPVDGSEATRLAIEAVNPRDEDSPPAILYGMEELIASRSNLKAQEKTIKASISEIDNKLRSSLNGSTTGLMHGYEVQLQLIEKQPYTVTPRPYTQLRIKEVDNQ